VNSSPPGILAVDGGGTGPPISSAMNSFVKSTELLDFAAELSLSLASTTA